MKVGVLGLQGDVREHVAALERAGATPVVVKRAEELAGVAGLILPGGESTTIGKLLDRFGLLAPMKERVADGMPVYGTCAGMILMAARVAGEHQAAHRLEVLDVTVRLNAYGRQVDSFETTLKLDGDDVPLPATFIRAPIVEEVGPGVDVLAEHEGRPVLVREGRLLASSFHPEMNQDDRVHELFLASIEE